MQEGVWMTILWADGQRDQNIEDYEPWSYVNELRDGVLDWDEPPHAGRYRVEWIDEAERAAERARIGV
jgi:hypothetical protein